MIYRLMKMQLGWRLGIILAVVMVPLYLLFPRAGDPFGLALPLCIIYIVNFRQFYSTDPCTIFEASLPIHGRQIFLARVLAHGMFIWLPVFAAATVRFVPGGSQGRSDARVILGIGTVLTVLLLWPLCLHAGRFAVAHKPRGLFSPTTMIMFCVASIVGPTLLPRIPLQIVLAVCAAITAALLSYGWARTPEAFEIVAAKAAVIGTSQPWQTAGREAPAKIEQDVAPTSRHLSRIGGLSAQMLLLRIVFSTLFPMMILVPFAAVFGLWGAPVLAVYVGAMFFGLHNNTQWLYTIPLSRHKLFALAFLPVLMLIAAGLAVHTGLFLVDLAQSGPGEQVIAQQLRMAAFTGTMMIAWCLLAIYVFHFGWWYRVRRGARRWLVALLLCLFIFGVILWMGGAPAQFMTGKELAETAMIWLAKLLPQSPLALGAILVAFLGLLYWIVDKQFSELDISLMPRTTAQ